MLFKTSKESTKEEREEIEMLLGQIDDHSVEMHQKINSKISAINSKSDAVLTELSK